MRSALRQESAAVRRTRQQGLSLIELMVALTIGSILLAGTVFVYVQSRNSYGVNETVARLQETARFALSVIEPDVRMSSYWGLVNDPELITNRATPAQGTSPLTGAGVNACGNNFAVNLYTTVEGFDDTYTFGGACAPLPAGAAAQPEADTLTIRRASQAAVAAVNTRLQICTTRAGGQLFSDGPATVCPAAPLGRINDMIVNTYYVSDRADDSPAVAGPALRRKRLIDGPAFQDEEIVPGVEDLQIQLGIDPSGLGGTATQYVNPDDPVVAEAQVVSVRIWILVRGERPEVGFVDNRTYNYGSRVNYQPNDGFRRVLFSRTIQVRNSLG